jgi:3-oxoacyl-[acyl-carrier protein] reductase
LANLTFNFEGKSAIVTGGAQGIGFEISKQFLISGAYVTIWDSSEEALQRAARELSQYANKLNVNSIDVTKRDTVAIAAAKLTQPVDILVNNAGITRDKSFAKMTEGEWDAVIATNLTGLFNVTKALFDKFNSNSQHKRIINISSVVGLYGNFGQTNYAAAKAGVIGMTKTWAKELGRKGWTSNAVAPGFISTPMTAAMPPEVLQQMAVKVPIARLGEVSDIANTVLFLASEQASYINGAVISVDGGLTL